MDSYGLKKFGFPDYHNEPAKWNEVWERMIEGHGSTDILQKFKMPEGTYPYESDVVLLNHKTRLRDLCICQHRLTIHAARAFAEDDLESKWLRSNSDSREKHLLEGMVRTCDMMSWIEDERANCEEVTLSYLQKANGRGFLTLLKHFMLEDTSSIPSTPIFLSSPRWDRMIGRNRKNLSDKDKVVQAYCDGNRNEFISHFLFNALASLQGRPPALTLVSKAGSHDRGLKSFRNDVEKLVGKSAAKSMTKDITVARKAAVIRCEQCRKSEFQLGDVVKFMCCKACKDALDRRVYYCSIDCQKADWVSRHKKICGKKLMLKDV